MSERMKNIRRHWKLIALLAIGTGIILAVAGTVLGGSPIFSLSYNSVDGWQLFTLDNQAEATLAEYDKTAVHAFERVYINVDYMDVYIEEGDSYALEYVSDKGELDVTNRAGTLTIKEKRRMYMFSWGVGFGSSDPLDRPYVKVYIPSDADVKDLKLVTDTGKVQIADTVSTGKLTVEVDFGNVDIQNAEIEDIEVKTDTGDIDFEDVTAEKVNLYTDMGKISGAVVQADRLTLYTDTGNVKFSELTVEEAEMETDFGSITLDLTDKEEAYSFRLKTDMGAIQMNGGTFGNSYEREQKQGKRIKVVTDVGSIEVNTR